MCLTTREEEFISYHNQTKLRYGKTDGIVAFHAIQSFKPGEVTPEMAHEIGKRLAKEMWGDSFEVVIQEIFRQLTIACLFLREN
ncbi:MAG: relaxase/mobilization nuclease domain-containing protein [Clostridia bacterium]|nr:relaxase/mobilization nuclease domain-containing protein [Clostridia bacterium]